MLSNGQKVRTPDGAEGRIATPATGAKAVQMNPVAGSGYFSVYPVLLSTGEVRYFKADALKEIE